MCGSPDAIESPIAIVRRFNRSWTQRIGVLDDSFLGSGRPLGPSRLLFEIDQAVSVRDLRRRLGLDSGYLSRLLRELEGEALVEVRPDPDDARRRVVALTQRGRLERADLQERSERLAAQLLDPLSDRQRELLAESLQRAERIVRAATATIEVEPAGSAEAREAVAAYLGEIDETFADGFDPEQAAHDEESFSGERGRFLLVRADEEVVGCGALQWLDVRTAEVKRMWVHPSWRGLGLAGRLLRRLEEVARSQGRDVVRLDTNASLTAAIAMYRSAGYQDVPRYNDNPYAQLWFEKRLGPAAAPPAP
ncbi:GNAT family N-acetyltransferase [Aeromicrobium sp. CTD01-1L150]|uniref:bifunctional helix-turn-helix transcriptional regulator/GNAT family N-acetyltransferase n=1 Tax=Aeromicrobium sp. CTD01-1L150 TaxID=3341830 RepID=UPI0035C1D638